jgi:hypothetical protein
MRFEYKTPLCFLGATSLTPRYCPLGAASLAAMDYDTVLGIIRPVGLAPGKAKNIIGTAKLASALRECRSQRDWVMHTDCPFWGVLKTSVR